MIVDEALSVGDVFFQAKCYHKFEEFKKQGKTIVFVSHDLSSISKYCDRVILLNQGNKLGEGEPKEMIDAYKRVLVGQYEVPKTDEKSLLDDEQLQRAAAGGVDKAESQGKNPQLLEYGNKKAEITEIYMCDEKGLRTTAVMKGGSFSIHMKVKFAKDLPSPIFAFTIKNIKGVELTGTNSMVEKAFLEPVRAGEEMDICFTQKMDLQSGEYLVSFGLTGYEDDDFTVYHRLYDALNITVISDKDTVGYYDMNSKVEVKRISD